MRARARRRLRVADDRLRAVDVVQAHAFGFVDGRQALRRAQVHQVARDLGLAVDHDLLAAGEGMEVDPVALAAEAELDARMRQAFGVHPCAGPGGVEQIDGHLLEDAGADAAEHVVGASAARGHGLDPGLREQRGEQQPGRAGADDRDLRSHGVTAPSDRPYAPLRATCVRHAAISSASRARASLLRRRGSSAPSCGASSSTASTVSASGRVTSPAATARRQSTRAKPRWSAIGRRHPERQLVPGRDALRAQERLADANDRAGGAAAPARGFDAGLEQRRPARRSAVLRAGRVVDAARIGLEGTDGPVGEVAHVDPLDRLVVRDVGDEHLAARERAPGPMAEAAGRIAGADDQPRADDQRACAEGRLDDALARRLLRPVVAAVAVVGGEAGAARERAVLVHRRVRERRIRRDARDEAVAADLARAPAARAHVGGHIAAGVDGSVEAAAGEAREVVHAVADDHLDAVRPVAARAAAIEDRHRVATREGALEQRRAEEDAAADEQEFHGCGRC